MEQRRKRNYNTEAQKKSYEKYKKKNDLINLCVRIPREKRFQYQKDAAWLGKSFARYIMDLLEEAHKLLDKERAEAIETTAAAETIENDEQLGEGFYRRVTEIVEAELRNERLRIAHNIATGKREPLDAETLQWYTGIPLHEAEAMIKQYNS